MRLSSVAVVVLAIVGCSAGPGDQPDLGSVTGVVTLDGKPLWKAKVEFEPASGRPSSGVTNAKGEYELVYSPDEKGAKVGKHTVRITTFAVGEGDAGDVVVTQPEKVPVVYNTKTELEANVVAGPNTIPFELRTDAGEIVQPQ